MLLIAVAIAPSSPEDAAAEARHVGRADGLQQEILGAFLQAPAETVHAQACQETLFMQQKISSIAMNR